MSQDRIIPPVRWGILGAARIAAAKTIPAMKASPWCHVQAIGARELSRAQLMAKEFGIESAYGSYHEVLDDPNVEAVYIALPNHLHVELAAAAAAKGKHVLCEKPIAMTAEQAKVLLKAPGGVKISEAFMVRHQPRWEGLRDILHYGLYGRPKAVQMHLSFSMNNPDDYRHRAEYGGGATYDLGCYTVMTARYVFEREPLRAIALAANDQHGVDAFTSALLDFGDGCHASFTVSTAMAAAQTFHVVCERGFVELPKPYIPARSDRSHIHVDIGASHDSSDVITTSFDAIDQYESEVTNFSKAIRGEKAPFFGVDDAVANMNVVDALFASLKSGRWEVV